MVFQNWYHSYHFNFSQNYLKLDPIVRSSVCLSRFAILCTLEQKVVTLNLTQCLSLYISVELLIIFEILSSSVSPSLQQKFGKNIQIFVNIFKSFLKIAFLWSTEAWYASKG